MIDERKNPVEHYYLSRTGLVTAKDAKDFIHFFDINDVTDLASFKKWLKKEHLTLQRQDDIAYLHNDRVILRATISKEGGFVIDLLEWVRIV